MDLPYLSVGFEQPPKLLGRRFRIQVSNKKAFHDVSPIANCLIVGCSQEIRQEDEVERARGRCFRFPPHQSHSLPPSAHVFIFFPDPNR
jgi:hypothetical protein